MLPNLFNEDKLKFSMKIRKGAMKNKNSKAPVISADANVLNMNSCKWNLYTYTHHKQVGFISGIKLKFSIRIS